MGVRLGARLFLAVCAVGLIFRLALLLLPPITDVRYYDIQAAQALLRGLDPYGHLYTGIPPRLATPGAANVFAYFPLVAVFLAPFQAAGDAVLGLVAADLVVGWAIYSLRGRWASFLSAAYILLPATIIFSTILPNDALVAIAFLALSVSAEDAGRGTAASALFGLALASSQFVVLLLPPFFYWYLREGRPKKVAVSLLVAAAAVAPFLAWNASAFVGNTVFFEFSRAPRPVLSLAAFGYNLNPTLSGLSVTLTGSPAPLLVRVAATAALVAFFGARVRDLRTLLSNSSVILVCSVLLLPSVFFWLYLELPFVTLLLWLALRPAESPTKA